VAPVPVAPVEDVPLPVAVPVPVVDWPMPVPGVSVVDPGWPSPLPVVPVCPAALPLRGAPRPVFGFTAAEPPVAGAGDGEFSVPSLPAVVPAPPVPEYAPVLSRAVPVPGWSVPAVPGWVVPAVPVPIGAPAFPPRVPVDAPEPVFPVPPEVCASAVTGQSVAAPASTPVPTHLHAVRFMTVAFSRRSNSLSTS
jgi:hypothetical protein